MDNCDINITRGVDKRPGTEHVAGEGTEEELDMDGAGNTVFTFWINRSETERFVGFIDPSNPDTAAGWEDLIQIFSIVDGTKQTVEVLDDSDAEVTWTVANGAGDARAQAYADYIRNGTQDARERFRSVTVEDNTFILNRTVATALEGTAITYKNTDTPANVRNQNNAQNVTAWSDFTHPPTATSTYPTRATLVAGGDIGTGTDYIWYATDDDVGLPQGFYWAISPTQPPWFQRLPTEGANSHVDPDTMPLRIEYTGSKFVVKHVAWTARLAGDSTTNPGPTFIGSAMSDMAYHQDRFWFVAGERIVSSRAGDLFNLWINSVALVVDSDPIDKGIQGDRISNGIFLESFRESLICLTDGSRQVEIRANGPITPQSVQQFDSTQVFGVDYINPTRNGSQLYFMGERDFANIVWEYDYSPTAVGNIATDLTERVHGYIPAESHWMTASEAHDQLFILTKADVDAIYVNKSVFNGEQRVLNAWYRWVFPGAEDLISCEVYDDFLYLIVERNSLWYLEKMPLGEPAQDTDGTPAQTLGYSVRLDRKQKIQGVYDGATNTTTWTVPFEDATLDEVVLAATWDTATIKAGGTRIPNLTVAVGSNVTTLTADGDWENNADGDNAPAYIGVSYEAEEELSELFVRSQQGQILHGNTQIMRGRVRHRDSGGYKVKITPEGRSELTKEYVVPFVGSTPIDGDQLDDFGEFQFRILAHSRNLRIKLVNDTPFPTAWVDAEFIAEYVPSFSPVR
jgi:hypothetical protein